MEKARKYGATVEAELGLVGGSEDGSCDHGIRCTDPDDAVVTQERQVLMRLQLPSGMPMVIIR